MPLKCEKLCTLTSLSSKFSDLKVIAGGGSGVVFSGVEKVLSNGHLAVKENSAVALKRLSLVGKGHCRVALRELRLLKRFKHENIVRTIKITDSTGNTIDDPSMEHFKDLDSVYVVEELLDTDLHKVIERNEKLSLETSKLLLYQLLRGLKYIHSANVIHRDIKPGNIFINAKDLTVKIGDYGLARVFDNRFEHKGYLTAVVSTRYYRAPEVMLNLGNYSFPVDVWSVGCVFGEMLLGKVMFPGENDLDQIHVICSAFGLKIDSFYQNEPSFPEHMFDGIATEAVDLLTKLLCIDPNLRITVEEALNHPFLIELHDPVDEPVCLEPFFIEHEIDNLPMKILKRKILQSSCLNIIDKKSYHSSEENLFKDFDETFINDVKKHCQSKKICFDARGDDTGHTSDTKTLTESCSSTTTTTPMTSTSIACSIPSFKDAMNHEELLDEPYRDPGVCSRKYHEPDDFLDSLYIPSITLCVESDNTFPHESDDYPQQEDDQSCYFSNLSPVIDIAEPIYTIVNTNSNTDHNDDTNDTSSHFLEFHGRTCADNVKENSGSSNSLKKLNEEILRNLNAHYTNRCNMADLMSNRLSKNSPIVHWDSLRFWI